MNKSELKAFIVDESRICESTMVCLPTTQAIAEETGCSQPTVSRVMQEMAKEGLLCKKGKRYYPASRSNQPRDRGTLAVVIDHVSEWTAMHLDIIRGASRALGPWHKLLLIQRDASSSRLLASNNDFLDHVEEIYDLPEGGDTIGVLFLLSQTSPNFEKRLVERNQVVVLNERLLTESLSYVAPSALGAASTLVDHLDATPVNELVLIKHKRAWQIEEDFLNETQMAAERRGYKILKRFEEDMNDPETTNKVMVAATGSSRETGIICPDPIAAQKIYKRIMPLKQSGQCPHLFSAFGATSAPLSLYPIVAFDYEEMSHLAAKAIIEGRTIQLSAKPRIRAPAPGEG